MHFKDFLLAAAIVNTMGWNKKENIKPLIEFWEFKAEKTRAKSLAAFSGLTPRRRLTACEGDANERLHYNGASPELCAQHNMEQNTRDEAFDRRPGPIIFFFLFFLMSVFRNYSS